MAILGLVVRDGIPEAAPLARSLFDWAAKHGHEVRIASDAPDDLLQVGSEVSREELVAQCDPIVVLGGDGTMIGVARYVERTTPKILGVNFGRLGFLTELTPEELLPSLDQLLAGSARYEERRMLKVYVERGGEVVFSSQALNDITAHTGSGSKLLDLQICVDGRDLVHFRADGLVVATPTGSTAYSLAAGGSIAMPGLPVTLITPICPHSLTMRPLILDIQSEVTIEVPTLSDPAMLSADGQNSLELAAGDVVVISEADNRVTFVRSPSKSYFEILRHKLNWGVANRER